MRFILTFFGVLLLTAIAVGLSAPLIPEVQMIQRVDSAEGVASRCYYRNGEFWKQSTEIVMNILRRQPETTKTPESERCPEDLH